MDIALEIWDTFIGDRLYASLLPLSLASSASLPGFTTVTNSTLSFFGATQPFVYEPATQLIYLEPSKFAYLSAWPRNNIYRQFLSFFLIVWYVHLPSFLGCSFPPFQSFLWLTVWAHYVRLDQDFRYYRLLHFRKPFLHLHLG